MAMKKCIILFMTAILASCSDTQLAESIADVKESELVKENANGSAEIKALVERARWGDGLAYLQLADCYRDGIGVKKNFLGMLAMVEQARVHGAIHDEMEYVTKIPEDNDIKRFCDLMNKSCSQLIEEKDSVMVQLATIDSPDVLAMYGVLCVESGDSIRGFEIIRDASERGSDFAALLNALLDWKGNIQPDKMKLEQLAERIPLAYKLLGKLSLKPDENGIVDERKVAYYYMKADEHALLSLREAKWLLAYHKDVSIPELTDSDVKRLESFIRTPGERVEIVADTVSVDSIELDNQ
ncbi:MAG: hypothetical protein SPE73_00545 [Prevotella sp.]|nr:hypothetical protein [Prevotella sp.]